MRLSTVTTQGARWRTSTKTTPGFPFRKSSGWLILLTLDENLPHRLRRAFS